MQEFDLIDQLLRPLTLGNNDSLHLRDDVALLQSCTNETQLISLDTMVAGVHFLPDDPAETIAKKLLRVNISDMAAKGARPAGYLLSLALPHSITDSWLRDFTRGLAQDQGCFGIKLLGGDTVQTSGPLTLSLTIIGAVKGAALLRSGARPGDAVVVGGVIGEGACGLAIRQNKLDSSALSTKAIEHLTRAYQQPSPQLELGMFLQENNLATASMDVSDGVLADLQHLCMASGVGAQIRYDAIPVCCNLIPKADLIIAGDDYKLLFTADPATLDTIISRFPQVSVIGKITKELEIQVLSAQKGVMKFAVKGYSHRINA